MSAGIQSPQGGDPSRVFTFSSSSRYAQAADATETQMVLAALMQQFGPIFDQLSQAGNSPNGVQDALDGWKKMSAIIDQGAGPNCPSFGKLFGTTGFADFQSPVLQQTFQKLVDAEKSLTVPLFPPSTASSTSTHNLSFYDIAHSPSVEITFPQTYFIDVKDQSAQNGWQWNPDNTDHRMPTPTGIGGYHDPAQTQVYCGFKVPSGLSWSCSRDGHDNWNTSSGDFIKSYAYGLRSNAKGDIYVKGSGDQMATWLFQQSGMAQQFRAILSGQ